MRCPTPCVCGEIVELDEMNPVVKKLPDGGNLVCDDCLCDECEGDGDCIHCGGDGACDSCGAECSKCDGSGQCKACWGRGYKSVASDSSKPT